MWRKGGGEGWRKVRWHDGLSRAGWGQGCSFQLQETGLLFSVTGNSPSLSYLSLVALFCLSRVSLSLSCSSLVSFLSLPGLVFFFTHPDRTLISPYRTHPYTRNSRMLLPAAGKLRVGDVVTAIGNIDLRTLSSKNSDIHSLILGDPFSRLSVTVRVCLSLCVYVPARGRVRVGACRARACSLSTRIRSKLARQAGRVPGE